MIGVRTMSCVATEKRRFARVEDPVCTWLSFRKDNAAYGTLTLDLGAEGARFSTLRNVQIGEHVLVTLQLPASSIECKGRVCWSKQTPEGLFSFGVRFLDLREGERDALGRHVDKTSLEM